GRGMDRRGRAVQSRRRERREGHHQFLPRARLPRKGRVDRAIDRLRAARYRGPAIAERTHAHASGGSRARATRRRHWIVPRPVGRGRDPEDGREEMTSNPQPAGRPAVPAVRARERRSLSRTEMVILTVLAAVPLLSIALRFLALPGIDDPGLGPLAGLGDRLNQMLSLSDMPTSQRNHVIYLLLIPTSAMLVTLARLTLGLRVLAFRSILISVAFHQSGLIASFILIALAILAVQVLRPWLRYIELPKYARLSVILCTMTVLMVGAILLGPWLRAGLAAGTDVF